MRTSLSRPFLIFCGILYLGFGLAVLLAPEAGVGPLVPVYPGFLDDLAGSHGGLNVAAGLFLLYAAFSGPWHRSGVLLVALMNAGYLAGRVMTAAEGGTFSTLTPAAMTLEAVLLALALFLAFGGSSLRGAPWSRRTRAAS